MKPIGWKNNSALFLIQDQLRFTYHDFYQAVAIQASAFSRIQEKYIILECGNHFLSYVRFIGALFAEKTVMLYPSSRMQDCDYLELIKKEINSPSAFFDLKTSPPDFFRNDFALEDQFLDKSQFIVRTSGSSGPRFKLVLHKLSRFIEKYKIIGSHFERTTAFSPAETIAGIETLLEVLTHEKTLISCMDQFSPTVVLDLITKHQVDYFQTTPSFMNLLLVSKALINQAPVHLKKMAYGSEPSVSAVIQEIKKILPGTELVHTYGMSEIGILKTITDQTDPTLFKLDEKFNEARLLDGILHVRSLTRQLCYLNADEIASPFGEEWFCTQDKAVLNSGYLKVLGRQGDLINIGGRKFFPIELEDLLRKMSEIKDVTISSEKNDMIGSVITATIVIAPEIDESDFRKAYKEFCEKNIVSYMHPHRIRISKDSSASPILKKMRKS